MSNWDRRDWLTYVPRPKVRKLKKNEGEVVLSKLMKELKKSPLLCLLDYQIQLRRGRFYIETADEEIARITPTFSKARESTLLLEVEGRKWREVTKGSEIKVINSLANDPDGKFHGLGDLNKSLIKHANKKVTITKKKNNFYFKDGAKATVSEVLFYYFSIPASIVAQPSDWYFYRRSPSIKESSADKSMVLVSFSSHGLYGSFAGTCLYIKKETDAWFAYKIRPSQSGSIETAYTWIVKRKWIGWN